MKQETNQKEKTTKLIHGQRGALSLLTLYSLSRCSAKRYAFLDGLGELYANAIFLHTAIIHCYCIYPRRRQKHQHYQTTPLWQAGRPALLQRNLQRHVTESQNMQVLMLQLLSFFFANALIMPWERRWLGIGRSLVNFALVASSSFGHWS